MVKSHALARSLIACAVLAMFVAPGRGVTAPRTSGTRCWIDHGALVAPAAFGDIAGDFLIDLAAPSSVLDETRARMSGREGAAALGDLKFAGRRLKGLGVTIAPLDSRTGAFATAIAGALGADVFSGFVVEIQAVPCRIRLLNRVGRPVGGAERIATRLDAGRPLVAARVTDGVRVRSGLFALDTATWPTTLFGDRLARDPPPGTASPSPPVRLRALSLGGRLFEQVPATVAPAKPVGGARGSIGLSVLSRGRLRLDMRHGWAQLDLPQ